MTQAVWWVKVLARHCPVRRELLRPPAHQFDGCSLRAAWLGVHRQSPPAARASVTSAAMLMAPRSTIAVGP